jgi:aminoglycoside phosphotransferase (APT) family kinase protein
VNGVAGYLAAHHERLGLHRLGVSPAAPCILVTPRFRESRHIVVLVLAREGGRPAVVTKIPRLPGDCDALAREARNLRAVERALTGLEERTAPTLISYHEDDDYPLLLETALAGDPLSPRAIRRDRAATVAMVASWLERLAAATLTVPADGAWYERLVAAPLRALAERADAHVRSMIDCTLERAEPLRFAPLPLVFEHGDFRHPNLLRLSDGRLGVLDWERGEPSGLPAQDLFFFLAYAAAACRPRDPERELRAGFFGTRPWAWQTAERYALRLGIDTDLLAPLLAVFCARAVGRQRTEQTMLLWRSVVGGDA